MKMGGGSQSTIIIGPSKSVLVYALHSLAYVLGLARFRMFVPKLYYIYTCICLMVVYSEWLTLEKFKEIVLQNVLKTIDMF